MKEEKGITLIALAITIIVLLIIAGVGIGNIAGTAGSVENTNSQVALAELKQVQQIVLETYIKSEQTHNVDYLLEGTEMTYSEIKEIIMDKYDKSLDAEYTEDYYNGLEADKKYYKLSYFDLNNLGLTCDESKKEDKKYHYMVNYSTGEVYNITTTKTEEGDPLYITK